MYLQWFHACRDNVLKLNPDSKTFYHKTSAPTFLAVSQLCVCARFAISNVIVNY